MTPAEAAALLAIAAAFDNRKPDADAAKAWAYALDGLRFVDCRDAILAHYRASSEWLMPKMVTASVRQTRSRRLAETPIPDPPSDMTPLETIAWLRDVRRRIADGEPVEAEYGELKPRNLPDLRELLPAPDDRPRADPYVEPRRVQEGGAA